MAGVISSLGIGSGIDIRGLVDQLLEAERTPVQRRLDRNEAQLTAELTSFGTLNSALSEFRSVMNGLADASVFRISAASSSSEAIEVTIPDGHADPARFDIEVTALARAQSLATGAFASETAAIGSGTLTFRFGAVTTDVDGLVTGFVQNAEQATATIEISAEASTLADVRDAVNAADIGVRASIINDGVGERLVFSSVATGAASGFLVDVTDDDGTSGDTAGLSQLAFNASATHLMLNRAGGDAALVVDGLAVTRPDNEIDDLIDGVTLTLRETTTTAASISVEQDDSAARGLIDGFVEAFNNLQKQIDAVAGYDAESGQGGILQGNSVVRSVQTSIRRLVTDMLPALEGRSVRALADIGITTASDGSLTIDDERLDAALEQNLDEVGALFGVSGLVTGAGFRFESHRTETQEGDYAVSVTQLPEQAVVTGSAIGVPSALAPLTIGAGNDELELTVDGIASGRITLTHGDYTSGTALAAELQARINGAESLRDEGVGVAVSFDEAAGTLAIASARFGSESTIAVTFADTTTGASLGLATALTDEGQDVAGTIDGAEAEGFGRYLTGQSGDADGLKLEITATAIGDLGRITFSRGISARLETTIDGFLRLNGIFDSVTDSIEGRIEDIVDERRDLEDHLARMEERLIAQFSAMDAMVARLNQTSSFLSRQLPGLEQLARRGSEIE